MNTLILFLLKSIFVSGLLTGWYWLGLRNKRLHQYNRFFLLFALCASIVVPLLHFQWFSIHQVSSVADSPATYLIQVANNTSAKLPPEANNIQTSVVNWKLVVWAFTLFVSAMLFVVLLIRVLWIIRMSGKYPATETDGIRVIHTDLQRAPFSFMNYVFWKDTIPMDSENGRLIYQHELVHVRQRHTWDKLTCQALTCVFWMNPFYWIVQKELGMIHEFIADEHAVREQDTDAFARMLLQAHNDGSYLVPQHQFFSSPIKRRLTMLRTTTKASYSTLRRFAVLPLLAGAIVIFSFTTRTAGNYTAVKADKKIVLVLDAGHGGTETGATYNGINEKDINLKIANRIKDLSPEYNVEVHLTRPDDINVTLQKRVDMCKQVHPDCFISVHVDNVKGKDQQKDDFEIVMYGDSRANIKGSHELAGRLVMNLMRVKGVNMRNSWSTDKGIYVLKTSTVPSLLLALGDINNKAQMERIGNPEKLDEICAAILKGIVEANKT